MTRDPAGAPDAETLARWTFARLVAVKTDLAMLLAQAEQAQIDIDANHRELIEMLLTQPLPRLTDFPGAATAGLQLLSGQNLIEIRHHEGRFTPYWLCGWCDRPVAASDGVLLHSPAGEPRRSRITSLWVLHRGNCDEQFADKYGPAQGLLLTEVAAGLAETGLTLAAITLPHSAN